MATPAPLAPSAEAAMPPSLPVPIPEPSALSWKPSESQTERVARSCFETPRHLHSNTRKSPGLIRQVRATCFTDMTVYAINLAGIDHQYDADSRMRFR